MPGGSLLESRGAWFDIAHHPEEDRGERSAEALMVQLNCPRPVGSLTEESQAILPYCLRQNPVAFLTCLH